MSVVVGINFDRKIIEYLTLLAIETKTNRSFIVNSLIRDLRDAISKEKKKDKSFDEKKILFSYSDAFQREGRSNTNTIKNLKPRAA